MDTRRSRIGQPRRSGRRADLIKIFTRVDPPIGGGSGGGSGGGGGALMMSGVREWDQQSICLCLRNVRSIPRPHQRCASSSSVCPKDRGGVRDERSLLSVWNTWGEVCCSAMFEIHFHMSFLVCSLFNVAVFYPYFISYYISNSVMLLC